MNKKVLYLSYDGMTDPLGQSQVIPYLAGLSEQGYEITILSCEKKDRFDSLRSPIEVLLQQKKIAWVPIYYHKKPPVLSTIWDLRNLKKQALRLHKKRNFSLIHCRSYIASLVGLWLKKQAGIPFIFDMRGFWADERVDGNLWNLKNPVYRAVYSYFKKKEREFLGKSAASVSLTHRGKEEILRQCITPLAPLEIIPCCVDLERFSEKNVDQNLRQQLQKKFSLNQQSRLLVYLGSIGTWYLLEEMLDFFAELNRNQPNYRMLFITQDNHERIRSVANAKGIPAQSLLLQAAAHKEVPTYLSLASAGISFIKPVYSKISSSPTKMGELLAMGVPIIANAGVGDTDLLFEKYQIGSLLHGFSAAEYKKIIQGIDQLENLDKRLIRNAARDYFSLTNGIERYSKIYADILHL